ncbi:hypothetical protein IFT59_21995 [Rhizobium sp. CFBP 8752]|uniref:hypothetical protein n=1 Tax=Rhizobium sp. CFBP 8752 TaxID=2775301 RepID=UPI00177E99CE|nr:hypothetical protein [Rhizobium sp. CFBP 8752]MBD8665917.1 hypothetical protein [Rhizobium sp. CFBP 8752]
MTHTVVAFVPSEPLALALAAYFHSRSIKSYELVMEGPIKISKVGQNAIEQLGGTIFRGTAGKIRLEGINQLYLHTYAWSFDKLIPLLERAKAQGVQVIAYADGLKAEYSVDFLRNSGVEKIVFFGWIFDKGGLEDISLDAVCLKDIVNMYALFKPTGDIIPHVEEANTAVVYLRYWGKGVYEVQPHLSPAEALFRSMDLSGGSNFDKVYVKSDPRILPNVEQEFVELCRSHLSSDVRPFSDFVGNKSLANDMPLEFLQYHPAQHLIFCFDSTVSIYLAALGEKRVSFPLENAIKEIFVQKDGYQAVKSYSKLYSEVCEHIWKHGPSEIPRIGAHP